MASRRLSEVKVLKNLDKPRNIINKKANLISGWHSANTQDVNDLVAWMSVKTKGDDQPSSSSTTLSRDSFRHGYSWCTSLEDKESFRRHSLSEHYMKETRVEQTKGDNVSFCECPPLKDDSQRKSLDVLVKSLNSQLPGCVTQSSSTLRITPTSTEKQQQPETGHTDTTSKLNDLAGKFSSKKSEPGVTYSKELRDGGYGSTSKSSSQESQVEEVKVPRILGTCYTRSHNSEKRSNKSTALSLPWLDNAYDNDLDSSRKSRFQAKRQLGDVPGADCIDVPGCPNLSELTPRRNNKAKLVYSKKDSTLYESINEDRKAECTNNIRHLSKVESRLTEVSLQQISPGSLSLDQNNHLFQADKRSRKNSMNFVSQTITNQQCASNLEALSSLVPKDLRPRMLVLRKISIQDSSETGDVIVPRPKEVLNQNRLSFSVLTPLKVHKRKKRQRRSSNVLVYQNDLLKSDKLSVPWIKPQTSAVNKNSTNSLQSMKTIDLPSSQLRLKKDIQDLASLRKNSKTVQSFISNWEVEQGDVNIFNNISNSSRPDLQYLAQLFGQNTTSPRRLSTQKFPEGALTSTDVALATASCEDLCSLSFLNLFRDDLSRCTSVPVEPQLSIPRCQGFRPYNSMSPLQRAKSISFRRLHGYVAHLPDGSETFKITAPNIPATRIDRLETAKKLNRT